MDDRKKDLCLYRLEKAEKCLSSAKALVQLEDYCSAVNRSYYSIFHGIRGLLALDGVDFSKHSGVIAYFQKNYVKSGIFEKEYSKILTEAFEIRSESDYDDYYIIAKEDAEIQIQNSQFFINGIMEYVNTIISSGISSGNR